MCPERITAPEIKTRKSFLNDQNLIILAPTFFPPFVNLPRSPALASPLLLRITNQFSVAAKFVSTPFPRLLNRRSRPQKLPIATTSSANTGNRFPMIWVNSRLFMMVVWIRGKDGRTPTLYHSTVIPKIFPNRPRFPFAAGFP
jgi:hypothetical protein